MIISKNWIIILSKGQERNHLKSIKGQKRKYQRSKIKLPKGQERKKSKIICLLGTSHHW